MKKMKFLFTHFLTDFIFVNYLSFDIFHRKFGATDSKYGLSFGLSFVLSEVVLKL